MRTLIQGGWVVASRGDEHTLIPEGVVVFQDDRVIHVGHDFDGPVDRTIDARGKLVSPGFIDTHVHFGNRSLHRLIADTGRPEFFGQPFLEVQLARTGCQVGSGDTLDRLSGMDRAARLALEAEYTVAELLRNGVTTFVEFGSNQQVQRALISQVARLGIRAYLAGNTESGEWRYDSQHGLRFEWDEARGLRELDEAISFIQEIDGAHQGLIKGILVPNKVETSTSTVLDKAVDIAKTDSLPLAIHAAYNIHEFYQLVNGRQRTPIQYLEEKGFLDLGPLLNLGHCNFVGENAVLGYSGARDIERIGSHGCSISHCPVNLVRRARVLDTWSRYKDAGVNLSLGTDTYPRDMVAQMRTASWLGKVTAGDLFCATAGEVFTAATIGGARTVGRGDLGRLAEGACADIVIFNLQGSFRKVPLRDPIQYLVDCGIGDDADTVFVGGKTTVENGRVVGLDTDQLLARTQDLAEATWAALPEWDPMKRSADEMGVYSFPVLRPHGGPAR